MPEIHLITGYMGFGKTTLAKKLAEELPAVRLTHDDFMRALFGWNLPEKEFRHYQEKVSDLIWKLTAEIIAAGTNVIIDYGFWTRKQRWEAYEKAKKLTDKVIFDYLDCDMNVARKRVLTRTETDDEALFIDDNCFNKFISEYQPLTADEGYEVIEHKGC